MSPLSGEEYEQVAYGLGPWLVGMALDWFFLGILTTQVSVFAKYPVQSIYFRRIQFSNYYSWYGRKDGVGMKIAVGVLALLTTLKSIQASIVWIQQINYFTDIQGALALHETAWYHTGNIIMEASISFYVQCYFSYRLYALSKMWWIAAPIMVLYVLGLASAIVVTYYIASFIIDKQTEHWISVHYASAFVTDLLLSSATAWFLLTNRKHVLPQTASLLNALARLTFQTAALPAICAMINFIFVYTIGRTFNNVVSVFIQALPKLYAISMMWTLNARRAIRVAFASGGSGGSSTGEAVPRSIERTRRDEIPLSNLNPDSDLEME
ncbi:uncharacterized protein BT62DRAFT_63727 [Guyanagaster necrorhizus]|uniref:DUF6534 domain-containing protein n=1 Tax=Guyanagaster necrorhizus TaxID=856835 RepID=A0A9P7VUL0_9AGAR|nr:uncharacterized protein BT62DRAFT_63727 [Guyanagaster necrorhizus MCA 3950]KAG7447152.1 hypothetical protein BT62DRAFT_63727 [Guyanagaster necrorhizus MCA 3950]